MLEPNAPTSEPEIAARAVIVAGFIEIVSAGVISYS
jgi:hypothetical protein